MRFDLELIYSCSGVLYLNSAKSIPNILTTQFRGPWETCNQRRLRIPSQTISCLCPKARDFHSWSTLPPTVQARPHMDTLFRNTKSWDQRLLALINTRTVEWLVEFQFRSKWAPRLTRDTVLLKKTNDQCNKSYKPQIVSCPRQKM